jgi:hypothetical protein
MLDVLSIVEDEDTGRSYDRQRDCHPGAGRLAGLAATSASQR